MKNIRYPLVLLTILPMVAAFGDAIVSDGSLGAFAPVASQTIDLNSVAPDGVLNYTTIEIPANVTIRFSANGLNTPVFLAATGDVVIDGAIDVSASHFSTAAGPGGSGGGAAGSGTGSGTDGLGPSPGIGGLGSTGLGNAGGGAGMGTSGLLATARTGPVPALPGAAIAPPTLLPALAGGGGSGGGGGGGRNQCIGGCVALSGGVGGGGGGALQIATSGNLSLNGAIRANGGHGGWAFNNIFGHAGPGGGGSGGSIELYGESIDVSATAVISARGGAGGGLSTEPVPNDPWFFTSGAHGGTGYLLLGTTSLTLDPAAMIDAVRIADDDGDGVLDSLDNCLEIVNVSQRDSDADGIGNRCDPDIAAPNDCIVNTLDLAVLKMNFFVSGDADSDFNGDGITNTVDLGIMKQFFFDAPGPSGLGNACN